MSSRSRTFVVTGASGFIGRRVVEHLALSFPDAALVGVGRHAATPSPGDGSRYTHTVCDLATAGFERRLPSQADIVMHLAADGRTRVRPEEYTAQTLANVAMTSRIADYALHAGARLLVFASSVYVYSGNRSAPFREDLIALPAEHLGATKLAAESLLKARAAAGQFRAVALRIFTTYGPGSKPHQFIPEAIRKLRSTDGIAPFGDPEVKRDFVYVDDVARAFVASVALGDADVAFEALNVGSGLPVSVREVVHLIAELVGTRKQIEFAGTEGTRSSGNTDHRADVSRIRALLGWRADVDLREGLRRTVEALGTSDPSAG